MWFQRLAASAVVAVVLLAGACGGGGNEPAPQPPPPGPPNPNPTPLAFVNWETPPCCPLQYDASTDRLFLASTPDHRLEVFDTTTGVPVPLASIPVGLAPVTVRLRTATEAWVVNHVSDSVSIVDLGTLRVRATLQTLDEPCDVVFANGRAFVSCSQVNTVQVFDPANLAAAPQSIPIDGEDPRALAVSPAGDRVYVAIFESGNATTILGGGALENNPLLGGGDFFPPNVVNDPATPHGGVNPPPNDGVGFSPAVNVLNPAMPAVGLIVRKDSAAAWMDDNGGDWTAFVSGAQAALSGRPVGWDLPDRDVAVIDTNTLAVTTHATGLMNICMGMAVNPADGRICVVGTDATNEIRFEPNVNGRFVRVLMARVDAADVTNKAIDDLNPHLTYATPTVPQPLRDLSIGDPRCIVFNTAGTRAFVAGMGSNNVLQVDANGVRVGTTPNIDVGRGPSGLAIDAARDQLYVWNRFEGTISIVDLTLETELQRVPIFDPTPPVIQTGRRHLYDTHGTSGLGQAACASCHVDARMDRLGWDLGDPSGDVASSAHQNCTQTGFLQPCEDYHPAKGPMTTQTLQDIIGHEPHHWRGDRDGIEAFNGAFFSLMGDDTALSPAEMQAFEDFLATIAFPPNPFRNTDNTLPLNVPLPGHFATGRFALNAGDPLPAGNAVNGLNLYRFGNMDGGIIGAQCVTCHTMPTGLGTDHDFVPDIFNLTGNYDANPRPLGPNGEHHLALTSLDGGTNISMKVPQLRNMHEKVGFDTTQGSNSAGFGFLHDGSVDSLARFVSEPLFATTSDQDVADLVAFMLAFSGSDLPAGSVVGPSEPPGVSSLDTHAAVGKQVTYSGGAQPALINELIALAQNAEIDLIVKGVFGNENRGWVYDRTTVMLLSDRAAQVHTVAEVLAAAAANAPQTWTAVPSGLGMRLGIDRDEDTFPDRDELDAGSDPTSQLSTP